MAAIATQTVVCAACDAEVEIPLNAQVGRADQGSIELVLTPDMGPLREHLSTHQ